MKISGYTHKENDTVLTTTSSYITQALTQASHGDYSGPDRAIVYYTHTHRQRERELHVLNMLFRQHYTSDDSKFT